MTRKVIHAAHSMILGEKQLVLLLETTPRHFEWFLNDQPTEVFADTIEEAIRLANKRWKQEGFSCLNCGFRYTLPERDEHGMNALFYQMAASFASMTGVYFDEELGNNCIIHNIPSTTIAILRQLKT